MHQNDSSFFFKVHASDDAWQQFAAWDSFPAVIHSWSWASCSSDLHLLFLSTAKTKDFSPNQNSRDARLILHSGADALGSSRQQRTGRWSKHRGQADIHAGAWMSNGLLMTLVDRRVECSLSWELQSFTGCSTNSILLWGFIIWALSYKSLGLPRLVD